MDIQARDMLEDVASHTMGLYREALASVRSALGRGTDDTTGVFADAMRELTELLFIEENGAIRERVLSMVHPILAELLAQDVRLLEEAYAAERPAPG